MPGNSGWSSIITDGPAQYQRTTVTTVLMAAARPVHAAPGDNGLGEFIGTGRCVPAGRIGISVDADDLSTFSRAGRGTSRSFGRGQPGKLPSLRALLTSFLTHRT
jgi:hypothetical protein